MKEDKKLGNDPETGNGRIGSPLLFLRKDGSSKDEPVEPRDSDNDSGFIGTFESSLGQIGEKASKASKDHDRSYYLRLIAEKEISTEFQILNSYNILGDVENCDEEECLTRIAEKLQQTLEILPDSLVNIMAGYYQTEDLERLSSERPEWLDMEKFVRGQKFAEGHLFSVFYSNMLSLFALYSFENGMQPMIITGQSSTPYTSFKRYLSTGNRVLNWYTEDPWTEGTAAHQDIRVVRQMHSNVKRKMVSSSLAEINAAAKIANPWCPSLKAILEDFQSTCPAPAVGQCPYVAYEGSSSRPTGLNQGEMACTQFGFVGLVILFPKEFGVHHATDEDLEAFCHVWRSIGYLLGIEDEYNFCRGSLEDVRQRSRDFLELWVKPNLRKITPEWEHMIRCIFEGLSYYFPGSTYETALLYLSEMLNLHMPRLYSSLSYKDWIIQNLIKSYLWYSIRIPGMKALFNMMLKRALLEASNFSPEKHETLKEKSYAFQKEERGERGILDKKF